MSCPYDRCGSAHRCAVERMISPGVVARLNMPLEEIENIVQISSRKLMQDAAPPVRYWLLRQVLERGEKDRQVQMTLRECASYPPKLKLLRKLGPGGTWPIPKAKRLSEQTGPGPPIGWTYRTMLWNLFTLSEYKTSRDEGSVEAALGRMLDWQEDDGYIPGPWTDVFPLPYFNGYALYLFVRFGLEKDSRVQKLTRWLLSMQRADGGWNLPFVMDLHYLPEYRAMRMREFFEFVRSKGWRSFDLGGLGHFPSCPYVTMVVVWGLMQQRGVARTEAVRRGADFVLDWFFKRTPHPSYYMTGEHWTRLRYPYRFGSGLMALDVLTELGSNKKDRRMDRPLRWLIGERSPDGLWSQSDRPHPDRDQWISLIALRILHRHGAGSVGSDRGASPPQWDP